MSKNSYPPKKFQQCTINKVLEELFFKEKSGPKRFLVADEVGLGKTIVAKHVIEYLRELGGNKVIIYVSSNLDISKQNRIKLANNPEKEIVHADRINLLFADDKLGRGVQIISMTPGTSLSMGKSLGNARERRYMAFLACNNYRGFGYDKAANAFCGYAKRDKFYNSLRHNQFRNSLPKAVENRIIKRWNALEVDIEYDDVYGVEDLLRHVHDYPELMHKVVKMMRKEMAIAILESLNPDLIIFDEFQKFSEITEMNSDADLTHEMGKLLLKSTTPTLLLSATPYRLYTGHQIPVLGQEFTGHYDDLQRTFMFLTGSPAKASSIISHIQQYGSKIQKINQDNVRGVLDLKNKLEKDVMKYMSRAERINFEGQNESYVRPVFLSDNCNGADISKENILEYLKVAKYCSSNQSLLTYWKSGTHVMSYLEKYKLIENACECSADQGKPLIKDRSLYSKLKKDPSQHIKIRYLYRDIFKEGKGYGYLWIPPTRPYYSGKGIYSANKVETVAPKKGLIFSSWVFVPKMVASELGGLGDEYFRDVKTVEKIAPSGDSWAKLYFPSTLLAESLSHSDFVNADCYVSLFKLARTRIEKELIARGYEISKSGASIPLYSLLAKCEFCDDLDTWSEYQSILKGNMKGRWKISSKVEKGEYLWKLIPISVEEDARPVSSKTLDLLAKIAISSPAVCFLRSIMNLYGADIDQESWLRISLFSLFSIRSFINRPGSLKAIMKFGRGSKPVDKAFDYFEGGNFQAVVDEYVFQVFSNKTDHGIIELCKKLSQVFGATKAHCVVPQLKDDEPKRVNSDIICCFGEGAEESNSRDLNREAFNSPFWPFVLTTTSVGQEGLDFHLYCNDIYHWNLPVNPVDFEQREGRLNRFNNYMIRQNIVAEQESKKIELNNGDFIWDVYLKNALLYANRCDRYNLGMSPHWVFSPVKNSRAKFNRHILDLPCSNDRDRYEKLMQDLDFYRLALGQPNQRKFMDKLLENKYCQKIDLRGVILNFFPFKQRNRRIEISEYIENQKALQVLINDCRDYLIEIKDNHLISELTVEVDRHIKRLQKYIQDKDGNKRQHVASIEALYYFVDPFDDQSDREPEIGFEDDLEKLKSA